MHPGTDHNGARHFGDPSCGGSAAYLRLHGGDEARAALADSHVDIEAVEDEQRRAREELDRAAIESSLTLGAAAESLGLTRSGVTHRVNAKRLYEFTIGRRRYLSLWQFQPADHAGGIEAIPGLERVLAVLPAGMHPLAVQMVMTTPLTELDEASPIGYLRDGGDPEIVAGWLMSMGRDI